MIRRLLLILTGFIVYIGFLIATFPAIHAWGFFKQQLPPIKASSIEGSVWRTHISNLQLGTMRINKVKAGLKLLPLLTGNLSINTKTSDPHYQTSSVINIGSKSINFSEFKAQLNANILSKFAYPGVRLLGQLKLNFPILTFTRNHLSSAQGSSVWSNARIHGPLKLNLGQVELKVKTRHKKIRGKFSSKGAADKITGSIDILANGQYHLKISFTPSRLSAEQRSWLLTISKAGPNGSFKFSNKGSFFSQSAQPMRRTQ